MKRKGKIILTIILILVFAAVGYGLYVWYKPQRDVKDEKAIVVTAPEIFDSYLLNESKANTLYLDKAVQVTGEISDIKKNQEGLTVVFLKTSDPIFGVNCTFKDDPGNLEKGTTITFKGICKGYTGDVVVTQGMLVN